MIDETQFNALEDRVQSLEYWVVQNKKNITGLYVGGHDVERKTKRTIQYLWVALAVAVLADIILTYQIVKG